MNGAAMVAIIATIGNLLQGWDNATIAGAVVYIKKELTLGGTMEGLVVATSLIGATLITTCSGSISDSVGRRPILIDGFGVGLAVTLTPIYISETAPPEIRGVVSVSCSLFILFFDVLYWPEIAYGGCEAKGKMGEAKRVLQRLRGIEDVSGEMALLVEGLAVGGDTSIEEYMIDLNTENTNAHDSTAHKDTIKLYGSQAGLSWTAKPVNGQSMLSIASRQGTMVNSSIPLMDPLVTLFGSVHEKQPNTGSMLFPNFGSMFSTAGATPMKVDDDQWDEESLQQEGEGYETDVGDVSDDDNLHLKSPLISRQTTSVVGGTDHGTGIGGGWQLAWKWSEKGEDGKTEGSFKRIYLHQEPPSGPTGGSRRGSMVSITGSGGNVQASALVSQPALYSKELMSQVPVGPAMVHPSETASKTTVWTAFRDPGVSRALFVGVAIQMLQQFSGINGVMYYTPQILEQAGVSVLLSSLGLGSDSASFLISAFTTLLMLPCIAVAMRFMDIAGRRTLLLTTIPILIASLILLVIGNTVNMGSVIHAIISTVCVVMYFCCFVMAYGPIPNILCAEIFPTRVRGVCIAICALVFWICDIIVTYSLPVMLSSIGLAGVFGIYAIVCVISWIFVFLKVPETKGMPLEVITEFFAVGARQTTSAKSE
ncbi:monosaccharide-sensing protein 2-like protein [Tanacetum coccineum]